MGYELRDYQIGSCIAAWNHLRRGVAAGNPVIELPTGTGKSVVIAELCRAAVQDFAGRVMVVAHRKELLEQNAEKIKSLLPLGVTCGTFSAGLRRYAMDDDVICGGIQSIYKRAADFGRRHLVIIDEAHLINDDEGMYRKFLDDLGTINPKLKVIGLTATPFRTKNGMICGEGRLFREICYKARVQPLIARGYLSPIVTAVTTNLFDTSRLHVRGGEFIAGEVEKLFDADDKTIEACREIVEKTTDRKSVLVFSSGVQHAEHVSSALEKLTGESIGLVTGSTLPIHRTAQLTNFKNGSLRWLVNVDVLTTGFDAPGIDAIAVLRAIHSPGLFAQIVGRGFRIAEGKSDCLLLDFGQNIARHGPIDSDSYGEKAKPIDRPQFGPPAGGGHKQCPKCETWVPNGTKACPGPEEGDGCGWIFTGIDSTSDSQNQILAKPEEWIVLGMEFSRHVKKSSTEAPNTLRVDYAVKPVGTAGNLAPTRISEWVCLLHDGFAGDKAYAWWAQHSCANLTEDGFECPIDAACSLHARGAVRSPNEITTVKDGKFYRVTGRKFGEERPFEWLPIETSQEPTGYDEWGQPIYEGTIEEELPF